MAKSTKRLFIVSIPGIPGTFRSSTGGGVSSEVTRDFDGGSNVPTLMGGPPDAEDLTITRTFDPARDLDLIRRFQSWIGRGYFTITKTATDVNFVKVGRPITYRGLVKTVTVPESDANSSDSAEWSVTFATTGPV